jgi:hypothetical protein
LAFLLLGIIIIPLLHTHLSSQQKVCDSSDQAAHYHTPSPKLGGFVSDPTLGSSLSRVISLYSNWSNLIIIRQINSPLSNVVYRCATNFSFRYHIAKRVCP